MGEAQTEQERRKEIRERWAAVGPEVREVRADEEEDYWIEGWIVTVGNPLFDWVVEAGFGAEQWATAYATACQDMPWTLDLLDAKDFRIAVLEAALREIIDPEMRYYNTSVHMVTIATEALGEEGK